MSRTMVVLASLSVALTLTSACSDKPADAGPDASCTPQCAERSCGSNGCGGTCGSCPADSSCQEATGQCTGSCVPETDPAFCARLEKACGVYEGADNCGQVRRPDCGGCTAPQECETTTNLCQGPCVPETDEALCQRLAFTCGSAEATEDNCGELRNVSSCGTCTAPQVCGGNACTAPGTPANDECGGAEALQFDAAGVARVDGNTTFATNSGGSASNMGFGNDLVYAFTLSEPKHVAITLTPGSAIAPVLYLRTVCDSPADQLKETNSPNRGAPVQLMSRSLATGTYFVWVDAYTGQKGSFALEVTATAPGPSPANDVCGVGAQELSFTTGVARVAGDTLQARDDTSGTCAAMPGGDLVYSFRLDETHSVTAKVTPHASSLAFHPAVVVRSACDSAAAADEKACAAGLAIAPKLGPGTYFVLVDGLDEGWGKFDLEVKLGAAIDPPANDSCTPPTTFDLSAGSATAQGNTLAADDSTAGTCGSGSPSGPDVVYQLTLSSPQSLLAELSAPTGSLLKPQLYLRKTCDSPAKVDEVACTYGSAQASFAINRLAAGTYSLWVDGYAGTAGAYDLSVSLIPPPGNDTCTSPTALETGAPVQGDTRGASDDYGADELSALCELDPENPLPLTGPDVVYSFTPTTTAEFTVSVVPDDFFDVAVWVIEGTCGSAPACIGLADEGYWGAIETLQVSGLAGTTYSIVVDSLSAENNGTFTIAIQ